jgi:hypothetical protein
MKALNFEQFMEAWYIDEHPEELDDDIADAVSGWLAEMTSEELFEYAEAWRAYRREAKVQDCQGCQTAKCAAKCACACHVATE